MKTINQFYYGSEPIPDDVLLSAAIPIIMADVILKDNAYAELKKRHPFRAIFQGKAPLLEAEDVVEFLRDPVALRQRNSFSYSDAVKAAQYACKGIHFLDEYVCPVVNEL